ncbi:MAG: hypothetical protein WCB99_12325 [Candidatus Cybelea sp.]
MNIYSMPDLTLKGQVMGYKYSFMQGECADRSGNIWVTSVFNNGSSFYGQLIKLAHDGTLLSSMYFPYGFPNSCAVDLTTGNLAVTEVPYSGPGAVVIYAGGGGPGKPIMNPQMPFVSYDGYDSSGHLWVDGTDDKGKFILSSCGASSCTTIPITGGTIDGPGFVQYAVGEKTWYIEDNGDAGCDSTNASCIYPVSNKGVLGTPISLTDTHGQPCDVYQGVIANGKSRVLAGPGRCGRHFLVARWNFPAGGPWTNHTSDSGLGAAISQK